MPLEPLAEVVVHIVGEGATAIAEAGFGSLESSRRRLWGPIWLGVVAAIVLGVTLPLPWSVLLALASVVAATAIGAAWQRAHRRRRLAQLAPRTDARDAARSRPPFA
jgi:hypothetical protein